MTKRKKKKHPVEEKVEPVPAATPRVEPWRWILVLLAVALLARLYRLGTADLWQDEMLFVMTAHPGLEPGRVLSEYWTRIIISMAWLPLPAVLQNIYFRFLPGEPGEIILSTFHARFPGVLLGTAGVLGTWLFCRRFLTKPEAWGASLIAALSLYPVFFAREAHAYPMLLGLAPFACLLYFRSLFDDRRRWLSLVGLFLVVSALNYTHLTAPFFSGSLVVLAGLVMILRYRGTKRVSAARPALETALASGVACLLILPVFVKILTQESPHLAMEHRNTPWFIWNDIISKLFLGEWPPLAVVAWGVFVVGCVGLWQRTEHREACRLLLGMVLLSGALITVAALRTQYLSPRYFAVMAPCGMVVYAAGFYTLAGWMSRLPGVRVAKHIHIFAALLTLFLAVHVTLFLPPMYRLQNKSLDFGGIARWLNENLAPGTPYVMESAYELRYVSGYYATPNLLAAAPYVHGAGPEERSRLRQFQQSFLERFPEAAYVQSAWDGYTTEEGIWTWPQETFRHHVELRDDDLRRLIRMGIYPNDFRSKLLPVSYMVHIHYNKPADIVELARERGRVALFRYDAWTSQRVGQGLYMRVRGGARGPVRVLNLQDQPVQGRVRLEGAIHTAAPEVTIDATLNGRELGSRTVQGNALWSVDFDVAELPPGEHTLEWGVARNQQRQVQALMIYDMQFRVE